MRANKAHWVIPVYPELVRLLGRDHIAAIYYQQMVFYDGHELKDAEGFFTKSKQAIETATALTRYQQDRARSKLAQRGWLAVHRAATKVSRYLD